MDLPEEIKSYYDQGGELELGSGDGEWDAVLLPGPLYHLPDRAERLAAWHETRRGAGPAV